MTIIKDRKIGFIIKGLFITLIIPIIIGILLFTCLFYCGVEYDFRDILLYIAGSVAILTFIMHNINGERNSKINNDKNEIIKNFHSEKLSLIRQRNSYEIVSQFSKQEMVESLSVYRKIKNQIPNLIIKSNVEPLKKYLKENPSDHTHLNLLLNCFENASLQMKRGYVDEEIIKDALHSVLWNVYCTLSSYIKDLQSEKGKELCWDEMVKVCKKWGEPK